MTCLIPEGELAIPFQLAEIAAGKDQVLHPDPPKSKINEPKELRFVATLASFVGSPQKWHVGEGLLVWSGRWGGKIILRHSGENWSEE